MSSAKEFEYAEMLAELREKVSDMKELIAAAVEHDDPKRVLREFMQARPELFGERKL